MYIRREIRFKLLFEDSWRFLLLTGGWAVLTVYLHDFLGWGLIAVPIVPLSTIGIAVSLYLSFRSKEAYDRWWETRKIWADIISKSRGFSNEIQAFFYKEDGSDDLYILRKEIVYRHLAWLTALKYQLRKNSRFIEQKKTRMFNHLNTHPLGHHCA